MKTISIMNVKGGVGKTITAVNLSEILATEYNKNVLLIDADAQADATAMLEMDRTGEIYNSGLYSMAQFGGCVGDYIEHTKYRNLDMVTGGSDLFWLGMDKSQDMTRAMADFMDSVSEDGKYDFTIIDCPPSFSAASVAAICCSDFVVIPVKLDAFGIRGSEFLIDQIEAVHDVNPAVTVAGILVTMWRNNEVCNQSYNLMQEHMHVNIFDAMIRRTDKVDESTFHSEALSVYSKRSSAGRDYRKFTAELLETIGEAE